MKKNNFFSHDANERRKPNMQKMMLKYGTQGYAWYFILLEIMREQEDYMIELKDELDYEYLAQEFNCETESAKYFVDDCIKNFGLLIKKGAKIGNKDLFSNMEIMEAKSKKAKAAANKRWSKKKDKNMNKKSIQKECESNANRIDNIIREEIREKEIRIDYTRIYESIEEYLEPLSITHLSYFNLDKILAYYYYKIYSKKVGKIAFPDINEWALDVHHIFVNERASVDEFLYVFLAGLEDTFWVVNMKSISNFRRHYETIKLNVFVRDDIDLLELDEDVEEILSDNEIEIGSTINAAINLKYILSYPTEEDIQSDLDE